MEHNYPDVFTTSESTNEIAGALLKFNAEMGVVAKKSKNPFFSSDYADLPSILEAIKEPMQKNGLTFNHFPVGDNRLVTRLTHSSGQYYQGVMFMKSVKDTPQDRGSVITYMMRYNVGAYLGLSIDKDDDGNKGSQAPKAPQTPVLKKLTPTVQQAMLKYIENGNLDTVEKKLPKYVDGKLKTEINKAIEDARNVADLKDDKK